MSKYKLTIEIETDKPESFPKLIREFQDAFLDSDESSEERTSDDGHSHFKWDLRSKLNESEFSEWIRKTALKDLEDFKKKNLKE